VSRSALLRDPRVAAAARFAAAAHEGQARKTGEPYVAHCVEAALIVERNLPRREPDADRCAAGCWGLGLGGWGKGGRSGGWQEPCKACLRVAPAARPHAPHRGPHTPGTATP
jgi:hypothetical protein